MTSLIIIVSTLVIYSLFWCWYVGFGRKVSPELIEQVMLHCTKAGGVWSSATHQRNVRKLLENDDGKEFVMVNLLAIKSPKRESLKLLKQYTDIFLRSLLKRGGHPIAQARALSGKIEFLNVPAEEEWHSAFLVRYRSRRDFALIALETADSEHHDFKLASLDRTIAFPAAPWFAMGGPKVVVALILALAAALLHLLLI